MQGPLNIRYHGFAPSRMLTETIEERVSLLERRFDHITDCNVTLEQAHRRHKKGNTIRVSIEIRIPGKAIVVSRERPEAPSHSEPQVVVRDAFDAAQRKLEDYAKRLRGEVKLHQKHYQVGTISKIFQLDGFGFITANDGREVYFHENAIVNGDFNKMNVGARVKFLEEMGEKGPQASSLYLFVK